MYGEIDLAVRQDAGPLCQAVVNRRLPLMVDAAGVTVVDSDRPTVPQDGAAEGVDAH